MMRRLNPSSASEPLPQAWRLERRVPVAVLFTCAMQCAALVAWGAYLEARVARLESDAAAYMPVAEKLARLEERIDALRGDIAELKRQSH